MENVLVYNDVELVDVANDVKEVIVSNIPDAVAIQAFGYTAPNECYGDIALPMLLCEAGPLNVFAFLELPMLIVEGTSLLHSNADIELPCLSVEAEALSIRANSEMFLPSMEAAGVSTTDFSVDADANVSLPVLACEVEALSILSDSDITFPMFTIDATSILGVNADADIVLPSLAVDAISQHYVGDADITLPIFTMEATSISGWLDTWAKRTKITLDTDQISAALSNFPVPIYLAASCGQSA